MKAQLAILNKFVSLIDNNDEQKTFRQSDNVTIMVGINTNKVINELYESLL